MTLCGGINRHRKAVPKNGTAQNRRSLADKAGDEQRQIHNQQENDDQTDEVGDDGLGNLFQRQPRDAGSDEQVMGDRRGDMPMAMPTTKRMPKWSVEMPSARTSGRKAGSG